ncbi:15933_t:CDS:1 [Acaulospora colombiana]|uniref:15933_t:CDS:1 n=1 Tax=Acaulospora colombiana TaxID=27376 RepID=A0ACA9NEH1_9GLOM|nr:15933_t:CDS:1 [Acaulospora colombiana]
MLNVVEAIRNNHVENYTAPVSQLEQVERDTLTCPGAPKLPSLETFEGPFLVDDELLAYYNRSDVASPPLSEPESLFDDDRDNLVCPGAPRIPFCEEFEGLGIMCDETLDCHTYCSLPTFPSLAHLEPDFDDKDRDNLVCPGAPKLEYFEYMEGLNIFSNEPLVRHNPFDSPVQPTCVLDDDNDEDEPRALFGLFPEHEPEPSLTFRLCSVPMSRRFDVTSRSTLLSTPPPPQFIEQHGGEFEEKEVEISSALVIAGEQTL